MSAEVVFQWVVGILGSLGLGTLKWIHSEMKLLEKKIDDHRSAHSALRETIAGEYVRRTELETLIVRFETKIDVGFQRLSEKLDKKADK